MKGSTHQEQNDYKRAKITDSKYIKQTLTGYINNFCNSITKDKRTAQFKDGRTTETGISPKKVY